MSLSSQLFCVLASFLMAFWIIRGFLLGIKEYPLNTSARKKRKKGQTFKEWFLYTRYREEIPKFFLVLYFLILFVHGAALVVCLVLHAVGPFPEMGRKIAIGVYVFDGAGMLLMQLLFWSSKPGMPYARWVKKRGMPPKKRK